MKTTIVTITAALALSACATVSTKDVGGKQMQVFTSQVGTFDATDKDFAAFKAVEAACLRKALSETQGKNMDALIPFNFPAKVRDRNERHAVAYTCVQAAGYTMIEKAPGVE